jgi:hypothetical protein
MSHICGQLDLEAICKRSKKKEIPNNFHKFWSEELQYKNYPIKKALMFECYNLMDHMDRWDEIF